MWGQEAPPPEAIRALVRQHYGQRDPRPAARHAPDDPLARVRRYNNYVKAVLLQAAVTAGPAGMLRVLDLGCGRGGDLSKYRHLPIAALCGVDSCAESVTEAGRRAHAADETTRTFLVVDLADAAHLQRLPGLIRDPVDLVVCMFSLQYFASSPEHVDRLFAAVNLMTRPGARCVMTLPDDARVLELAEVAPAAGALAQARLLAGPAGPWGRSYDFELQAGVACPEYLVPGGLLADQLAALGWRVQLRTTFDDPLLDGSMPGLKARMRAPSLADLSGPGCDAIALYTAWLLVRV